MIRQPIKNEAYLADMLDVTRLRADFRFSADASTTNHWSTWTAPPRRSAVAVIERVRRYQMEEHANVHRGVHSERNRHQRL